MKWDQTATKTSLKHLFKDDQLLLLWTAGLMLLPFYIGGLFWGIAISVIAWRYRKWLKQWALSTGWIGAGWLFGFVVAIVNRNMMGIGAALCFGIVFLYFVYYKERINAAVYLKLMNIIVLGSLGTSALAIGGYLQYIIANGESIGYIFSVDKPGYRAMATLFNANYYGMYCIFVMIMGCYLFVRSKKQQWKLWYALSVLLNFIGILLTASRMVLPALVVGVVCFLFFVDWRLVWVVGGIGIIGLAYVIFKPDTLARFSAASLSHGLEDREWIWGGAWRMFEHNPLTGRGPMSYATFFYLYEGKAQPHAHQIFLEMLSSYGLMGVTLYIAGMVHYFRDRIALWATKSLRIELGLIVAMIAVVLVHGLTDVSVMWVQTGFIFLAVVIAPVSVLHELAAMEPADYLPFKK